MFQKNLKIIKNLKSKKSELNLVSLSQRAINLTLSVSVTFSVCYIFQMIDFFYDTTSFRDCLC